MFQCVFGEAGEGDGAGGVRPRGGWGRGGGAGGVCDGAKRLHGPNLYDFSEKDSQNWFYLNAHATLEYATVFFRLGVQPYKAFKGS